MGASIAENSSIKHLNLSWNNIRRKGANGIAKGLAVINQKISILKTSIHNLQIIKSNSGLKIFNIGWNGFAQDGAKAFSRL